MLGNYSLRLCTMLFNKPDPVIYLRLSISRFAMAYSITCHADARARMPAINRGTCSCMHTMPFRLLDARSYRETRTDLTSLYNDFVFSIFFPSFFFPHQKTRPRSIQFARPKKWHDFFTRLPRTTKRKIRYSILYLRFVIVEINILLSVQHLN